MTRILYCICLLAALASTHLQAQGNEDVECFELRVELETVDGEWEGIISEQKFTFTSEADCNAKIASYERAANTPNTGYYARWEMKSNSGCRPCRTESAPKAEEDDLIPDEYEPSRKYKWNDTAQDYVEVPREPSDLQRSLINATPGILRELESFTEELKGQDFKPDFRETEALPRTQTTADYDLSGWEADPLPQWDDSPELVKSVERQQTAVSIGSMVPGIKKSTSLPPLRLHADTYQAAFNRASALMQNRELPSEATVWAPTLNWLGSTTYNGNLGTRIERYADENRMGWWQLTRRHGFIEGTKSWLWNDLMREVTPDEN